MNALTKAPLEGQILGPNDGIEVNVWQNPFSTKRQTRVLPTGSTINEILGEAFPHPRMWRHVRVWLENNEGTSLDEVPREFWGRVRPRPGVRVMIKCVPGGKNKNILGLILGILVMIAAFYLAPAFMALTGITSKTLAFGILSTLGSAIVKALVPPPKTNTPANNVSTQKTFTLTGTSNRAAPFDVVPMVYGKVRLFPTIAGAPYNEIIGASDVYLRMLFDLGPGPMKLSDIKIGDTPITNFQDVQIEVGHVGDPSGNANPAGTYYAGFSDDRALTLYPRDVAQVNESIKIDENSNIVRSFPTTIDDGRIFINFPRGLFTVSNSTSFPGAIGPWTVIVQAHYREIGTGTWIPMIPSYLAGVVLVSEGSRTVQVFDDVSGEGGYTNVVIPAAWDEAAYMTANPTVNSNYNPPGVAANRRGLHHYANIGAYEGKAATWVNGSTARFIFTDQKQEAMYTQYATPKLDRTKSYEFRLNRYYGYQTPGTTKVSVGGEDFWLNSIQGFKSDSPVKNVQGHALMAIRIRASEQLNGTLQNLSVLAERMLPIWNGSSWSAPTITRSPVWAALDVMRGQGNARPLADARLDLATWLLFQTWTNGNNSKGHPRAYFDGVFDAKITIQSALQQILAPQRASFAMKDGKYSVIWDDVKTTPVQLFTPKNSRGFEGRKVYINAAHALKIRFNNELKNYTEDELTVYADGYSESNATLFEQMEAFGLTRAEQVHWFGRYMIATALLRPEIYTLDADIEGLVCRRGDLVRAQHDVTRWGIGAGRVRSLTTNAGNVETLTFEETFLLEPGKDCAIRGRRSNGTIILANVNGVGVATETKTLTLVTPTAEGSMIAVGDLAAFGERTKETVECVVRSISRLDDLNARMELLDYSPDIFTSDTEAIPDFDTQSTWQGAGLVQSPPTPTIASIVSDESVLQHTPQGYIEAVEITLSQPTAAQQGQVRADDVMEVRYRHLRSEELDLGGISLLVGEGSWLSPTTKFVGNPMKLVITKYIEHGDEFEFQVRRITYAGLPSDWSAAVTHTVIGRTTKPINVLGFTAQIRADDVLLFWTQNTEKDIIGYELRVGSTWDTATKIEPTKSPTTTATQYTLAPLVAGSYTYLIKAIDSIGLLSETAASVAFNIVVPSTPAPAFAYQGPSVAITWEDCQTSHRVAFYRVKKGAAAAVEIKTTSAIFPVDWTGALTFEVWAVDIAGNESAHASLNVTNTGAGAPANFTHSITGETVQLSWDQAVAGSLPIREYELRYDGADWGASTFLARVLVTTYLTPANWSGARTMRLRAVDTAGNLGTETTRNVNLTAPASVTIGSSLANGLYTLTWGAPSSLLPIKEYEIRYGASYAAGTHVATVTALTFTGGVNWTATRSFWIVARTTTGLESTPAQHDLAITAPAAPEPVVAILGPDLQITWAAPSSSLPVARYQVKVGGTDFASATHVAYVDTTLFQTPITWSGTRTYRIAAIDTSGLVGAAGVADATIVSPSAPQNFISEVVDNNVLLRWSAPALHSLPISHYLVKIGSTWAGATSIGEKQGTFTSHFLTSSGTYKYWVAAIDSAGNEGTPVSLDTTVSQPPDYVLKTNFNSTLNGTLTNAILDGGAVYMPALTGETFQQHFDNRSWASPQAQIDAGYPIFIQPTTGSVATYVEVFDFGAEIPAANITVTATYETIAGTIAWSGRVETSSDGSSYTDVANPGWTGFDTTFRYVRMTVSADGTDDTAVGRLTALNLRIDLKAKSDSGVITCNSGDSGGTTVTFNTDFLDVDSITATPRGTTFAVCVVDFTDTPNPTSFKILVFDASGTRLTRDVGWEASGV